MESQSIGIEYDYHSLMREVDYGRAEMRILAMLSDPLRRQVNNYLMSEMSGNRFDGPPVTTQITHPDMVLTWDMLEETLRDMEDRDLQMKCRTIEALERAGIRVTINPYVPDDVIVAVLPSSYKKALEKLAEKYEADKAK